MLSVTLAVHGGQEKKSDTTLPDHKALAARVSELCSADSRESLRYKIRALALLKLCSREFTQTAAAKLKIKSDMATWSYNPSYFRGRGRRIT